jgi:hypothetical protein
MSTETLVDAHAAPARAGSGRVAVAMLMAANLVPLALVLAGKASVGGLVILYWAENLVIGLYALLRMATAQRSTVLDKISAMIFFCPHYGIFCLSHGMVVMLLFGDGSRVSAQREGVSPFLSLVQNLAAAADAAGLFSPAGLLLPLLALFASHGVSFAQNYLLNGRYRSVNAAASFWRPYPRMVLLHIMIFAGAYFIERHGSTLPMLAGLVAGKTLIDLALHWRANRNGR